MDDGVILPGQCQTKEGKARKKSFQLKYEVSICRHGQKQSTSVSYFSFLSGWFGGLQHLDRTRWQADSSLAVRCVPRAKYLLVLQRCQRSETLGKVPPEGAQRLPLFLCLAMLCLVSQICLTLCDRTDCSPPGSSGHGDSPGQNTGVRHALLQRLFQLRDWI